MKEFFKKLLSKDDKSIFQSKTNIVAIITMALGGLAKMKPGWSQILDSIGPEQIMMAGGFVMFVLRLVTGGNVSLKKPSE